MRPADLAMLAATIKSWDGNWAFQAVGIADTDLSAVEPRLAAWLASGFAGELDYMRKHGAKRTRPASLVPGTLRIISARMTIDPMRRTARGFSRTGARPSSRVTRSGATITRCCGRGCGGSLKRSRAKSREFGYRVFTDSAPVMEVELARKAGLGWRGKHTLLIARRSRLVLLSRGHLY